MHSPLRSSPLLFCNSASAQPNNEPPSQQDQQRPPADRAPNDAPDPLDRFVKQGPGQGRSARRFSIRYKPRKRGFGTALGGGVAGGVTSGNPVTLPLLLLPTLEMRFFRSPGRSFDVQIPVLNMIIPIFIFAGSGVLSLPIAVGFYYSLEYGRGRVRFVLSPGAQFSVAIVSTRGTTGAGFEIRPGVGLGLLVLTEQRGFEFQLRARPFIGVGLAAAGNSTASATGFSFNGGAVAELAFIWY